MAFQLPRHFSLAMRKSQKRRQRYTSSICIWCNRDLKFLEPQLSFFRPNSEWIDIKIQYPSLFSSHVMHSKKDDMFLIHGSGLEVTSSHHGISTNMATSPIQRLRFRKTPFMTTANKTLMDSRCKSELLVESRTTVENLMVKLYKTEDGGTARVKTKALMMFKLDDKRNAVYTQDGRPLHFHHKVWTFVSPNRFIVLDVNETAVLN